MIKKTTLLLFVCLLSIIGHNVLAVPAVPWPVEKIQPDGSKITVYLRGDEKVHWMESLDGYTLMYNAEKYIVYAEQDVDKNMIPSKSKYSGTSAAPSGVAKGIRYSQLQVRALKQIWEVTEDPGPQRATTGSRKALCVLMGFTDRPFSKPTSEFETLFNQLDLYPADNSSKGSVRDFFRENSYGQLDLTVTLVGPYTASNTCAYYATHEREFAEAAARAADADVDYTDFAEGGVLETFHILFAGYGDESIDNGQQIWSHKWQLSPTITLDGVRISVYSCSPELRGSSGTNTTYIGVVCHELSHVFGAPDYYDTDGASGGGNYTGSGNWDLMANGSWNDNGRQPGHINMFQKILYGWVTPEELTSYRAVAGMPNSAQNPVAYTIKANTNGEMYVLENRQRIGFDGSVPGHGLLIWHVHQNALAGRGSNAGHPQQLYPVCASSTYAIPTSTVASYGNINSGGTPFPGTSGKTSFSAKTTPTMFSWTGLQAISKPLTEIAEASDNTISFKFLDGPTEPVTNLQGGAVGGNVTLTWTAPIHPDALGYKIYRDGLLQYTINGKPTTSYTQIGVANGTYEYGVSAFYEATESVQVMLTVVVDAGSDTYNFPPTNLQGRTTLDKAYLNWTRPFNGGWMTIAGSVTYVYDFGTEFTFFAGTSWGPEQLKGLDGFNITQIQFYMYEIDPGVTHKVQVWEVTGGVPVLVRTQNYTGTNTRGSKTVTLTSPYAIDASKEYRIGVEIHTLGGQCLITDDGPMLPGRNWFYEEAIDQWFPMEDVDVEQNFFTAAYLNSGNPSAPNPDVVLDSRNTFAQKAQKSSGKSSLLSKAVKSVVTDADAAYTAPAVTKYNIYRDGVKVGESPTVSFDDTGLAAGTTYSYCVSAVYSNNNESEGVCIELTTLSPVSSFNPAENVKAKAAGDEITLTWEAPYSGGAATYVTSTSNPTSTNVNVAEYTEAIRFEPNDLKRMEGFNITSVRFYTGNNTSRTYTIQIWSGGNGSAPGTLIHEQAAAFTNNAWSNITLTSPVPVDIYEDLWIGVKVTRVGTGSIPSPRYTTGGVNGKSNLYLTGTTWSMPNNVIWPISATIEPGAGVPSLTGYRLSRNGTGLGEVSTSTFSYLDEGLQPGNYNYCVTALYGADESDAACASVTAEEPVNPYKPVENMEATLVENKATLDWEAPFRGGPFGYSASTPSANINGITSATIAARFTKEELKQLLGTKLARVYFVGGSGATAANTTYSLRIYAGVRGDEPERVIYDQAIPSFTANAWNEVLLSAPFDVNVYEDLWIGIVISGTGAAARAVVDAGPAVEGKGNVILYNGAWTTLTALNNSLDYNWAILGYAEPGSSLSVPPVILSHEDIPALPENIVSGGDLSSVPFNNNEVPVLEIPELIAPAYATPDSYLITRNGEDLTTVAGGVLTYDDFLSVTGDYTYCVIAQYSGGQSDSKCDDVSFVSECDAKPENVTATRTDDVVTIDWDFTPVITRVTNPVFNIYENDVLIDQVTTGNQYILTLTASGTYTYCVSFEGVYCESESVCADDIDFYQLTPTVAVADKIYDTTKDATVQSVTFAGLTGTDVLRSGVDYTITAEFSDANVGTGIPADGTITLLGTVTDKYWLPVTVYSTTADITPAELTLSGLTAANRVYDGTTNITVTGTPTLQGILGTDVVTFSGTPSYALASPNAGTNVAVTVSGISLSGAQAGNYVIAPLTVTIFPAELILSGLTARDKTYDGTTAASATGTAGLSGIIGADDVWIGGSPNYDFATPDAGSNISVFVSGIFLDGNEALNYFLSADILSADITPAAIIITPTGNQWKYTGEADPDLTYTSGGWKLNHDDGLLTGTLTRASGESVGTYPIQQGTLAVTNTNYIIDFTNDVFFEIRLNTGLEAINVTGLKVYPNPVRSGQEFTVESKTPNAIIRLFSIGGTLLKEQKATDSVTKMNLTLPSGIYILSVDGEKAKIEIR